MIVAVIDSGIDTLHEDLKPILWTNPKEIPGNGIDDDGNGYIDDIHGWNFLGGKDGKSVDHETLELTREYVRLSKRFKDTDPKMLHGDAKKEYDYYQKVKEDFENCKTANDVRSDRFVYTTIRVNKAVYVQYRRWQCL